ncbi:MAG: hypothetical protein S4CHLAM37_12860 [Chlamydiia bacterium]|nr:hypothetical protein [Chlamydiia bacterium]
MKLRSKAFFFLFFFCLFLIAIKGYDKFTEGFYPSRAYPKHPIDIEFSCSIEQEAKNALGQSFHYLSSGSQSYVFISDDDQYVLKLFKHYRWEKPWYLPLLFMSKEKKSRIRQKREEGRIATYNSCIYSFNELKKESGLIHLQLNPRKLLSQTVVVRNKLKIPFHIDLDKTSFALQYKALGIKDYLIKCKNKNDLASSCKVIDDLFAYIIQRREKQFTDKDPHFLNNFGLLKDEVIAIDIGGLIKDPNKGLDYFYSKELVKAEKRILPWLNKHYPALALYTKNKFNELKSNGSE